MQTLTAQLSRQLSRLAESRKSRNDGELLSAFLSNRDEAAFAELVRRHGPLVWGACRRLLPDPADAEDAFQAAFLVLVRRARQLREQPAIGPWLHKVATWTARNIRRRNARTLASRVSLPPDVSGPNGHPSAADLQADLDGALLALPEKYRTPLILCHLQGWSRRDAAARLGCPEGTLSSLLSRGLARLRAKLGSYDPTKLLSAVAVPAALASATVRAATASRLAAAGVVPASVSQLVEGVIHMFWVKKATAAMAGLVVVFGFGLGVGVSVKQVPIATAVEVGAGTGPSEIPGQPTAPTNSDGRAKELQALKDELAAVELLIKSAEVGVALSHEKLKLSKQAIEAGTGSLAERISDEITLTRFAENLAVAKGKRSIILRRIAELKSLMASAAGQQPKPATAKPLPAAPDDLQKQLNALRDRLRKNQADTAKLAAQHDQLQAAQKMLLEILRALEKSDGAPDGGDKALNWFNDRMRKGVPIEDALKRRGASEPLASTTPREMKNVILLDIGAKDMRWVFTVTEHDRDGRRVGTAQLDSIDLLQRYLARAGKDSLAPHEVRVAADKNIDVNWLKQVLAVVSESGLKVSSVQLSTAGQGGADDSRLLPWEQLVRDRDEREAARKAAELQMLKNELERLKKLKTQPPINPARP